MVLRACAGAHANTHAAHTPLPPLRPQFPRARAHAQKIKYILHGDDPCFTADGQDAYAYAKQIGVYKQVKRTEGVSTTDIVGRMLLMTREHHVPPPVEEDDGRVSPASCRSVRSSSLAGVEDADAFDEAVADAAGRNGDGLGGAVESTGAAPAKIASSPRHAARRLLTSSRHSRFLPTARRIMQFAEGRVPKPEDKVVYMAGSWDVFNPGHVAALAAAREHGTFLLVGSASPLLSPVCPALTPGLH